MRKLVAPGLAVALLATASSASAARSPVQICETHGRSLAGGAQVRVYEGKAGRVVACSLENGRRMFLGFRWLYGSSSGSAIVRPLVVAGRMVAWQPVYCAPFQGCERTYFAVADVHSGRVLMRRRFDSPAVTDAVLRPNGSAAWIEAADGGVRTLHRLDPSGEAVLAEGDVRDLALSERSTLYWTEAGVPRSVPLEPVGSARGFEERRPRCGENGTTVAANPWGRLYDPLGVAACSIETGRDYFLGESSGSSSGVERAGPAVLSGRLVAYYRASCGGEPFSCLPNAVNLLDLRSGRDRTIARVPDVYDVQEIVLKRNGSIAFTAAGVRIADRRGERVVGGGSDLALSKRSVVYWTAPDGTPAAAPLE